MHSAELATAKARIRQLEELLTEIQDSDSIACPCLFWDDSDEWLESHSGPREDMCDKCQAITAKIHAALGGKNKPDPLP